MLGPAAPPVAGSYVSTGPRKRSVADQIRAMIGDVPEMLNGTGITERLGLANDFLNPIAAIPRAQAASQEMFAPDRTAMQRVASGADMLTELTGFAAPVAAGVMAGRPAVNALAEGMTGLSSRADNALDAGRMFAADESGALRLFHGSPHDFDRFDAAKAGTGTGAQRFGSGIYAADDIKSAKAYAKQARGGNIYEISADASPEELIQWDEPFANQPKAVRDVLKPLADRAVQEESATGYDTGGEAYSAALDGLAYLRGERVIGKTNEELAAPLIEELKRAGVKGAVFPDDVATDAGKSYVLYDDRLVNILGKNGERTTPEGKAQTILDMLQSGLAGEVTDEMLDLGDATQNARLNQYLFRNYDLPMDEASRMERAGGMGFDTDTPLYHGSKTGEINQFDLGKNRRDASLKHGEGVYTSPLPEWAKNYGSNMYPLLGRNAEPFHYGNEQVIRDPSNIRSRFARFDPRLSHLKNLSAGVGGIGLMGMYQEPEQ